MQILLRLTLYCILGSALMAPGISAGTLQITPTRITLSQQDHTAVLTIRNQHTESRIMQLETVSWKQQDGEEVYAPTREILATPPIFTIPPGGTQIVRVGIRRQPSDVTELSYRLFLQEVPIATTATNQVRIALRFGIPVFVTPVNKTAGLQLDWRIITTSQKILRVEAINQGNAHVQILSFMLTDPANKIVFATHRGMNYLLPGQRRSWSVNIDQAIPPGAQLRLVGETDGGKIHVEAPLEP